MPIYMSFDDMRDIYLFNNARREALLAEALKQPSATQQMQFVANYFLNNLPTEQIAKIDNVSPRDILPFKYDYSFLEDYATHMVREKESRRYNGSRFGITLQQADVDKRGKEKINIYPTTYSLKMGTCIMFAAEIQRFSHDFGLPCEIVDEMAYCYDKFDGKSTEGEPIKTNRIVKMHHYYNILTIDGKKYKLDIAGALTAQDFNKEHPTIKIDPSVFYFSEDFSSKPFEDRYNKGIAPYNLKQESQPE